MSVLTNNETPDKIIHKWRFAVESMVGPDCLLAG